MPKILRKFRNKFFHTGLPLLIWISVKLNLPAMTAWLISLTINHMGPKQAEANVLVIGRTIFTDDVRAMTEYSGRIHYVVIHNVFFRYILDCFDKELVKEFHETNYYKRPEFNDVQKQYYQYLLRMWPTMQKLFPFEAVISGNLGYVVQQEIARVCMKKKTAFVVLHKEAIVTSDVYDRFMQFYSNHQFVGHKIMFYNQQCMQGFLRLNLPGLSEDKATFVGIPRFDSYFNRNFEVKTDSNKYVYFSFLPEKTFQFITKDPTLLDKINQRTEQFIKSLLDYFAANPQKELIVKTKNSEQYVNFPKQIIEKYYPNGLSNVRIANSGDPSELIDQSHVVFGFNSTTLIESLIANKPVVCPFFGDILANEPWTFFQRHAGLITYHQPEANLNDTIARSLTNQINLEEKNSFLNEFISTTNGGASKRAEEEILKSITELKQPSDLKVLAVIPARGGSKGLPGKNIRQFCGKPLLAWTVAKALDSQYINRVIVSTDSSEIAEIAKEYGAEVPFLRPDEISGDHATDVEFLHHTLDWLKENENYQPDIILRLPPTSPLATADHVDQGIAKLIETPDADAVRPITKAGKHPYKMWSVTDGEAFLKPFLSKEITGMDEPYNMPRQKLPQVFVHTGAMDVIRYNTIRHMNSTSGKNLAYFYMEPEESINIDEAIDFDFGEFIMKKRLKN